MAPERLPVTVLVTIFNDHRVGRVVESLLDGTRIPHEILLADGGSTDGTWELCQRLASEHEPVRALQVPGSVAETRNGALPETTGEVVAFLDTDEVAPANWLEDLVEPIEAGTADFTGGPTQPLSEPESRAEAYVNRFDAWFYRHVVPRDLAMLPMGNSAWRRDLLLEVGGFDPRLTWGGEDYDLNLRVLASGAQGAFVPNAWVHHDQSHLDTLTKLAKRRYRYMKGATVAYLKNGHLSERVMGSAGDSASFRHPYEVLFLLLKPVALVAGWWTWRTMDPLEDEGSP